jgi:hypothetical protein
MTAEPRALNRSEPVCQDPLVQLLYRTGWRGTQLRMAYAIAWRESNGKAGVIGRGGYGLFQLQASAHSGKPWWDWDRMLEAGYNAQAAYLLWKDNGWRPWGLDKQGNLDPTEYRSWSPAQQQRWIVEPFHKYLNQYDKHCEE